MAGHGHTGTVPEGLRGDVGQHLFHGCPAKAPVLVSGIDHQMPHIVFRHIKVINDHHIAHHGIAIVDAEGGALVPVHIGLRQTADGGGDKRLLTGGQFQMKCVKKIVFVDWL